MDFSFEHKFHYYFKPRIFSNCVVLKKICSDCPRPPSNLQNHQVMANNFWYKIARVRLWLISLVTTDYRSILLLSLNKKLPKWHHDPRPLKSWRRFFASNENRVHLFTHAISLDFHSRSRFYSSRSTIFHVQNNNWVEGSLKNASPENDTVKHKLVENVLKKWLENKDTIRKKHCPLCRVFLKLKLGMQKVCRKYADFLFSKFTTTKSGISN